MFVIDALTNAPISETPFYIPLSLTSREVLHHFTAWTPHPLTIRNSTITSASHPPYARYRARYRGGRHLFLPHHSAQSHTILKLQSWNVSFRVASLENSSGANFASTHSRLCITFEEHNHVERLETLTKLAVDDNGELFYGPLDTHVLSAALAKRCRKDESRRAKQILAPHNIRVNLGRIHAALLSTYPFLISIFLLCEEPQWSRKSTRSENPSPEFEWNRNTQLWL